ncbi:hypothetical protein K1T71_011933 [Dendrolimus kikuchii]|uniref:Uncharacterized protein n=1 Tax=Dendrolimus kikuchii TaxID=765133 RepID=A0ACC1CN23_9NEOP|nr:hypothetical protein K1T71_011933 [Dendrolimus kikuchii]
MTENNQSSLVWLHNPVRWKGKSPKLQSSWEASYTEHTRINDVTYQSTDGNSLTVNGIVNGVACLLIGLSRTVVGPQLMRKMVK